MLSIHSDENFMQEAYRQALQAREESEIPVGAVVVCKNKIVAKAYNQTEKLNDCTAHAEMLALTAAFTHLGAKYLPDCALFVTLEPCTMCAGALFWAQIGRVIFAAEDPQRGYSLHKKNILHPKTKVIKGILAEKSKMLIEEFFRNLRN